MAELTTKQVNQPGMSIEQIAAVGIPGLQPVFFFDGQFRTWREVQHRAGLNNALAAQIPSYLLRSAA